MVEGLDVRAGFDVLAHSVQVVVGPFLASAPVHSERAEHVVVFEFVRDHAELLIVVEVVLGKHVAHHRRAVHGWDSPCAMLIALLGGIGGLAGIAHLLEKSRSEGPGLERGIRRDHGLSFA